MKLLIRPVGISAVVLLLLFVLQRVGGQNLAIDVAGAALVVIPIADAACAYLLWRAARRHPDIEVLRITFDWVLIMTIGAFLLAIVSFNTLASDLFNQRPIPRATLWFFLVAGVAIPGARSILWLIEYYRGRL